MKVAILLVVLLSACTTNNYTYTDSSRTTIRVNESVVKAPVKRQQPKVRDCVNPYQAEKKLCEGVK